MTALQGLILGIIQGIGEFLPISSSAHLILVPWLLGWTDDGGLTFDVALHAGTLVALLIYFRKDWIEMIKALVVKEVSPSVESQAQRKLVQLIVLATIPGAIMGMLLEKKAEEQFRNPAQIAVLLALMGVVLWISDRKARQNKTVGSLTLKDALVIGVAQGFAVIPGVSRSGITITAGLWQGANREAAARFSFLMSMPIIAGACILKLRHLHGADLTPAFWTGVIAAAISGYLAIGGLIRFLQTRSYLFFAAYRLVAGAFILLIWFTRRT